MSEPIIRRRAILAAAVSAVPLAAFRGRNAWADDEYPLLDEADATAKAIGYVADAAKVDPKQYPTYKQGQDCSNCQLYYGDKDSEKGACELVLGQFVLAKAWCKAWEQKT
ncbi:MAG: high-potential iron-sulfur protein [Steroidobacteraceae bacterium]